LLYCICSRLWEGKGQEALNTRRRDAVLFPTGIVLLSNEKLSLLPLESVSLAEPLRPSKNQLLKTSDATCGLWAKGSPLLIYDWELKPVASLSLPDSVELFKQSTDGLFFRAGKERLYRLLQMQGSFQLAPLSIEISQEYELLDIELFNGLYHLLARGSNSTFWLIIADSTGRLSVSRLQGRGLARILLLSSEGLLIESEDGELAVFSPNGREMRAIVNFRSPSSRPPHPRPPAWPVTPAAEPASPTAPTAPPVPSLKAFYTRAVCPVLRLASSTPTAYASTATALAFPAGPIGSPVTPVCPVIFGPWIWDSVWPNVQPANISTEMISCAKPAPLPVPPVLLKAAIAQVAPQVISKDSAFVNR
jgi:hypothetical protein